MQLIAPVARGRPPRVVSPDAIENGAPGSSPACLTRSASTRCYKPPGAMIAADWTDFAPDDCRAPARAACATSPTRRSVLDWRLAADRLDILLGGALARGHRPGAQVIVHPLGCRPARYTGA